MQMYVRCESPRLHTHTTQTLILAHSCRELQRTTVCANDVPAVLVVICLYAAGVVGLENDFYRRSESDGSFQVCVTWKSPINLECPSESPFNISVSIIDNNASKKPFIPLPHTYSSTHSAEIGEDYSILDPLSFSFEYCQLRSCLNISINNDNVMEEFLEAFSVRLGTIAGLSEGIMLKPVISRVLIFDDKGQCHELCVLYSSMMHHCLSLCLCCSCPSQTELLIGFDDYAVNESDSSVVVCVVLSNESNDCRVVFQFDIMVYTEDGTASEINSGAKRLNVVQEGRCAFPHFKYPYTQTLILVVAFTCSTLHFLVSQLAKF